jgi:hypothetical protein
MAASVYRQRALWGGVLMLIGTLLLLHKLDVFPFGWETLVSGAVAAVALFMIVRKFREHGEGVFWWTLLFCYGLFAFVRSAGWITIPPWYGFPLALIAIGVGFAVTVALRPTDWHLAVPSALFLVVGSLILLSEMGTLEVEMVRSAISAYWPFALIVFGVALLMSGRERKQVTS